MTDHCKMAAEIEALKLELSRRSRAMRAFGDWYQCKKCGEYSWKGYVCHKCGHDRTDGE